MTSRYLPALFVIFCLFIVTSFLFVKESSSIEGFKSEEGMVTGFGSRKGTKRSTYTIVEYRVNDAVYACHSRGFGYPAWKVGDQVRVLYSTIDPSNSRISRIDEIYSHTLLFSFFLFTSLLFLLVNFIAFKIRGRPLF